MDSRCNVILFVKVGRDMDMRLLENAMLDLPEMGYLRLKEEKVATVLVLILLPAGMPSYKFPACGIACCG